MMDNHLGIVISSTCAAVVGTAVSVYAVYKWIKAEESLSYYLHRFESEKEISRQLVYSFSDLEELPKLSKLVPQCALSFHENLARYCSEMCILYNVPQRRILDVGCGVGGLSFNLSKTFNKVIGTDVSYGMIAAGQQLKQFSKSSTSFSLEGGKYIKMMKLEIPKHCNRDRVEFWDEDVCALVYKCGKFNCVLAANVITHLSSPMLFLTDIAEYVEPNGLLIIADSFNWQDGPENLLESDGSKLTPSILKDILEPSWSFCKHIDIPYCIPQNYRSLLLGNCDVMVWQRKNLEL